MPAAARSVASCGCTAAMSLAPSDGGATGATGTALPFLPPPYALHTDGAATRRIASSSRAAARVPERGTAIFSPLQARANGSWRRATAPSTLAAPLLAAVAWE